MLRVRRNRPVVGAVAAALLATSAWAASPPAGEGVARLAAATDGQAVVRTHRATGMARFVTLGADGMSLGTESDSLADRAQRFFDDHGSLFGIQDAAEELVLVDERADRASGGSRLTYRQQHRGVPVFGAMLRAHFDGAGRLRVVNGAFVPEIEVDVVPWIPADRATELAIATLVARDETFAGPLAVRKAELVVFRQGLVQGVAGTSRLAWQLELTDSMFYGEMVFVDAHYGKVLDRYSTIHDAMFRRAFNSEANYPGTPFWVEGQPFPTANAEANNILHAAKHTYDFFFQSFGYDSWNGAGGMMDGVFNRTTSCPNASWNGTNTSFCPGVSGDDTVAHEWGHAYTDSTHDLIYQWQSGALNESYSDVWGETVDVINGYGTDNPGPVRTVGACSSFGNSPLASVTVPGGPATGTYVATTPAFGPALGSVTSNAVLVTDTNGGLNSACTASGGIGNPGAINGNIALIRRGAGGIGAACAFTEKVKNAQLAGAVGVIVMNNIAGPPIPMGGSDGTITIPSVMVNQADGDLLQANSPVASTTMAVSVVEEDSYRWHASEDDPAFGNGIRDMWEPICYGNPGKVSDGIYVCGPGDNTNDNGGVHSNSGVPNHGYALLVDGGTYNGVPVTGIGLAKAAHIYWRAQSVYQVPVTDFEDHADSLYQSCLDLVGQTVSIYDRRIFSDGFESGDTSAWVPPGVTPPATIAMADCDQVDNMADAVELREAPVQCAFVPLLDPATPALCGGSADFSTHDFEAGAGGWTVSRRDTTGTFEDRDWVLDSALPGGRAGQAFFGPDPVNGDCGADIERGVLQLTSPVIGPVAGTNFRLRFDHWVATEAGWDGGNLKISVNGGAFTLVPAGNMTFNAYNDTLETVGAGSDNPMAGEAAFTGANDGSTGSGSWGQTQVNLNGLVAAGQTFQLRFELGTDGCNGAVGWYVDDVVAYTCP